MAQADNLNNTSSRWWSLAQTLVWITQRIERPPRNAEEITYSPSIQPEIERAFRVLISEFWEAALGVPKGVPIDKFRIPCGRHYVDLLTLFRAPSAESGALSAAMDQFVRDTRWQDVECNSDWLKRAFPAPAPAMNTSAPVTNTDAPAAEPEAADASQAKHPGGAPAPAPAGDASVPVTNTNAPAAELEAASPPPVDAMATAPTQQILRTRKEQSQWLKTTLADNPPGKDEPLTPEGYGKRIAEMGMPLGARYEPSAVIARYYQLNPKAPRRRKPRK